MLNGNQDAWLPILAIPIEKTYVDYIYVQNKKYLKISARAPNCKIRKTLHVAKVL